MDPLGDLKHKHYSNVFSTRDAPSLQKLSGIIVLNIDSPWIMRNVISYNVSISNKRYIYFRRTLLSHDGPYAVLHVNTLLFIGYLLNKERGIGEPLYKNVEAEKGRNCILSH